MAKYIKTHSNYVLRSKHQLINDGTIWERDITTIGGVDQFSPGQMPIYRSGNFIITVRSDSKMSSQHNSSNWEENEDSGEIWTLESLDGIVSTDERQNDTKIVLKQDYYDFRDFAYYGSLTELFRASVTDIIDRFPGELYSVPGSNAYYTSGMTVDFERVENSEVLGNGNLHYVSNPFGIDLHTKVLPNGAKPLKFFAENGFENYVMFQGDDYDVDNESAYTITNWEVTLENGCIGEKFATITIDTNSLSVVVEGWFGDNKEMIYLCETEDVHIRPKKKYMDDFYNGCDNFEYLLMNPKSTPLYKSTFSVIRENDFGYYRELVPFEFPKSEGGYNIDATNYGFNDYTNRMVEIGDFYDERFSDNLYRSMTHESIKNFDWSHTREYNENDDYDEAVLAGQKVQKAIRVFAREFDEILPFIDNIRNTYTVSYDERNNVPDYFLTDVVGNEGWDVKLVIPYNLLEYFFNGESATTLTDDQYTEGGVLCNGQLNNKAVVNDEIVDITREFSQVSTNTIKPYSKDNVSDYPDGYFVVCSDEGNAPEWACGDSKYTYLSSNGEMLYNDGSALSGYGVLKNRVKTFTDEREYTYLDANNAFLRRLKINSRYIWRHKGTEEGLEMILGMFGLKSKRWVEKLQKCSGSEAKTDDYDYEITEYTSFAERLEEKWDANHQSYRIDWINSTKSIVYDNRFVSNYNPYGRLDRMNPYQGIPVSYRDEYVCNDEPYIKMNNGEPFRNVNENNAPVLKRYLYPHFDKNGQLDGNPYFQMDGGWLSKKILGNGGVFNFQYDVDDNIVYNEYVESGYTTDDEEIIDNHGLYKETIRNIRRVDNVASLLQLPSQLLSDKTLCYVTSIEKNSVIIDDSVYEIKHEYYTDYTSSEQQGVLLSYISFIKANGAVRVGQSKYFSDTVIVYDKDGFEMTYDIAGKPDGYELKAYIVDGNFICKSTPDGTYSIERFTFVEDEDPENTNYFMLDNPFYSDVFAMYNEEENTWGSGWRRLKKTDYDYLRINTITNYFEGNNGHNGNMRYDSGHEYFTYFKRLFKYAIDEGKFDERCYDDFYHDVDDEIYDIGFSGLIDNNESILQYDTFLYPDKKIHFFGNYKTKKEDGTIDTVFIYGDEKCRVDSAYTFIYSNEADNVIPYRLNDGENTIDGEENIYKIHNGAAVDEVTDQIVNNKRFKIKFYLYNKWYSRSGQEEIKYLDSVVMSYLEQMIPSTVIVDVEYEQRNKTCDCGSFSMWLKKSCSCNDIISLEKKKLG